MPTPQQTATLEAQIAQWREFLRRRQAIHAVDVAELEDHLREQVGALTGAGLAPDEAFLVAVKRMGSLDAVSREFAREHSERLWKQLVIAAPESAPAGGLARDTIMAFVFAAIAGALGRSVTWTLASRMELPDPNPGPPSCFEATWTADGATLLYSTLVGGTVTDMAQGIAVDGAGAAHCCQHTGGKCRADTCPCRLKASRCSGADRAEAKRDSPCRETSNRSSGEVGNGRFQALQGDVC